MKCKDYKQKNKYEKKNWKEIIEDSSRNEEKILVAKEAIERRKLRKKLLQPHQLAPEAP